MLSSTTNEMDALDNLHTDRSSIRRSIQDNSGWSTFSTFFKKDR